MLHGRSNAVVTVPAVLGPLSFVTVCFRCYVRIKMVKNFGWDDGIMAVAAVRFALVGITGGIYGIGQKTEYFHDRIDNFRQAMLCWWIGQQLYSVAAIAMRVAICLTLLPFTGFQRIYSAILYTVIVFTIVAGVLNLAVGIFQCSPVSYYWDRLTALGKCHDDLEMLVVYINSSAAIMCDLVIGILPAILLRDLKEVSRGTRVGIVVLLGLGWLAITAVIVRLPYVRLLSKTNFLYDSTGVAVWSDVETGLGITAESLAVMRPAFSFLTRSKESDAHDKLESSTLPSFARGLEPD
ncbi:hypothetical protein BDV32DRAFT_137172 [Aspergillus pseudonomiae]|uniref:Rhodopsin domain-containing protein n=1 Tax=Aspergillus pseudonomiae TaxID=1506151 RepID=A0A5N7DLF3_9EURO|nr:uncharacterized protein BDV37DRAFT_269559 [Aspergillus pseudonomiae]KAB8261578.1 hypothetical protein BDV32DRAFT_137172 [Aspergillus pseudonomiae]KAE8406813.1 hypothetical protein BDV37DRAFT_269559 [Aspergillus pseudonomiae]